MYLMYSVRSSDGDYEDEINYLEIVKDKLSNS